MNVKKLCFVAMLICILFVQEELLSFLPNIQLTVLLIMVYASVLDLKTSSLIVLIHVMLDCLVTSSFNLIVMIPMFIGWLLTVIISYLLRNKNLIIKCVASGLCAILYCLSFAICNVIFLHLDFVKYMLADAPFMVILMASSVISVMFLFEPLEKILKDLLKRIES